MQYSALLIESISVILALAQTAKWITKYIYISLFWNFILFREALIFIVLLF